MAQSWQSDVPDRPAPRRSATAPGARRRLWPDAKIDGVEVSWRTSWRIQAYRKFRIVIEVDDRFWPMAAAPAAGHDGRRKLCLSGREPTDVAGVGFLHETIKPGLTLSRALPRDLPPPKGRDQG